MLKPYCNCKDLFIIIFFGKIDREGQTARPRDLKLGQIVAVLLGTQIQRLAPISLTGALQRKQIQFTSLQSFGQHKLKWSLTYLLYDARRTFHIPWLFKVLYIKGSEIDIKQL